MVLGFQLAKELINILERDPDLFDLLEQVDNFNEKELDPSVLIEHFVQVALNKISYSP
jgi:hypothetical protein